MVAVPPAAQPAVAPAMKSEDADLWLRMRAILSQLEEILRPFV